MRSTLIRRVVISAAAIGLTVTAAPAVAHADAATVNRPILVALKVQGPDGKLFSGSVITKGHDVTTATGGTHKCDGTNGGANATPGATPTAALDSAARAHGFTWDGVWYPSFDDYFVDTIKGVKLDPSSAYWNISVNGTSIPVGGCQFHLKPGDAVAFTWTPIVAS
ncbi:hypothetical protein AMK26_18495 [Streptomyces sp. CB03234]|jgi:hypothetical protein|uniref:DUF4430 domain-containing protein n=1 Tax=Streptomyces sp. (strain CB03234) TaxID=1703937 RepID=UPI00093F6A8C|nr:DUF4430 domain-containing protein [Streptomyces sp. CB03234]OKK03481.1 hypothetical protein AMK26_18495 [Streptomyces sp. CB03234]